MSAGLRTKLDLVIYASTRQNFEEELFKLRDLFIKKYGKDYDNNA